MTHVNGDCNFTMHLHSDHKITTYSDLKRSMLLKNSYMHMTFANAELR